MKTTFHDFSTYYYNFLFTGNIHDCYKSLDNKERNNVTIENISDGRYFIIAGKSTNETISPKIGKKDNFKVNELKAIDLKEEDELYGYLFILIDLNSQEILSNSGGIVSSFKTTKGEPSIKEVSKLLQNIFANKNCGIEPIIYKKTDKYGYLNKTGRAVSNIMFKVAGLNPGRKLIGENDKTLDDLFKLKDILGGNEVTYSIKSEKDNHLKKKGILSFLKKNEEVIEDIVVDIDEFGSKVSQRLEKIRFKDSIKISIADRDIQSIDEIKEKMDNSFNEIVKEIKKEYNFTS